MSIQAMAGIPRKAPGVKRIVICEEVFDYKLGGDQIAVLHPRSAVTFAVKAPMWNPSSQTDTDYIKAIKKAIWQRFTELQQKARQ